jgi:hypothetical protein
MSKTTLVLLLALGLGGGFLIARYAFPAPAPVAVEAPKPVVAEKVAPVAQVRAPRTAEAPVVAEKSEEDIAKEEFKARAKAFSEETKKMVEEISGGDQAKLQRAMFAGMMKPEGQAIMAEARELGEAMRNATPAEREALGQKALALRDRAMNALRAEMAAVNNPAPAAPVAVPAEAGAPAAQPAPLIFM